MKLFKLLVVSVGALALVASHAVKAQELAIGVSVALTGTVAFAGVPSYEGMQIAADVVNASKLLGNAKLVMKMDDSASNRGQAITGINRLAGDANLLMMIGPTSSPESLAGAPVANELKFPMLTATVVTPDVLKPGPWSFKTVENPEGPINFVTDYALKNFKPKRVISVFAVDNDGMIQQKNVARRIYEAAGVEVISEIGVRVTDVDFSAVVTKLVGLNPDLVFLTLVPEQGANFIAQAKQAGLPSTTRILGTESMASEKFIQMGGAAVEGATFYAGWYADANTPGNKAFVEEYRKRFGKAPNVFSAQGYTALMIAAHALKNAGAKPTRESVRAALTATKGVPIPMGAGSVTFEGDRVPRYGAVMLTVRGGKFVIAQ